MTINVLLEKLLGSKEATVGNILKNPGEPIQKGETILTLESKKGNTSIKSPVTGIVESIETDEGKTVKVGDTLAKIQTEETQAASSSHTSPDEKTAPDKINTASKRSSFNYLNGLLKPKKEELEADITIIGAGPGGYVAAIHAAQKGAKVILIEKERLGGTCLNKGCIPTKALIHTAHVFNTLTEAAELGIGVETLSLDMKKVIARKDGVVNELVQGIEYLLNHHQVRILNGQAEVLDSQTVFLKNERSQITIKTQNIIIATGSKTSYPPIPGIHHPNVLTSTEALNLDELPSELAIVGGGVIGMEFAFLYANLGVKVSVIEYMDHILAILDEDVCEAIEKIAREKGIKLYTHSKVESILESENGGCVISFNQDGQSKFLTAEKVLASVGREPVMEGIDPDKLGLELNANRRGIQVNDCMQTNIPGIYAIGDVTNKVLLAHVASHQGIVAVNHILGEDVHMDYSVIPNAIFTDPEIASVGLTEKAAREQGPSIKVGRFPFAANGKALTLGASQGFVKILCEEATGKVIGATILGPHATELIAELTLAIKNGLTTEHIIETIHAHPTLAESIHEAALATTQNGALHFVQP